MTATAMPAPAVDAEAQLRSLARRINRGDCLLVLGPGAATVPGKLPEIPLTVDLANLLAQDERVAAVEGLDRSDLRHVTQVLYETTRDRGSLQEKVADYYLGFATATTPFHRNIAALPFRMCLTTTPDEFLFNALVAEGKKPVRAYYNFRKGRADLIATPTERQPLVYHLYGHPDDPESLVITASDLVDFVASVVRNDPPLAKVVRGEMGKSSTTCLFMDLGFKNWYLRALLRALGLHGHEDSSIAIEAADFFAEPGLHQTAVYFSASQAIRFLHESLDAFAQRLRGALATVTPRAAAVAAVQPGAPRVFLSYAHEDRAAVDQLGERLQGSGIAVWQDHQNLRIGDRWAEALVQVIDKQVDYVIFVQTPTSQRRFEGVFRKELLWALDRQKGFAAGFRFLLPVRLGVEADIPEVASLHSMEVGSDGGLGALAAAIAEDWQRRSAQKSP